MLNKFPSVIMLHGVSDDRKLDALKPYIINKASFTRLLDVLEDGGYTTTNFIEFYRHGAKSKQVIITFDDCPKHLWDFAIPELQKRKMQAVFYMPTDYIGGYNDWDIQQGKPKMQLMNEDELHALVDIGMEVGAHSHQHVQLATLSRRDVKENLQKSKEILEKVTGVPVISMAYPFGSLPDDNKELLKEAGYQYGVSIYTPHETRYDIRRWIYHDDDDADRVRKKLSTQYKLMRALKDKLNK